MPTSTKPRRKQRASKNARKDAPKAGRKDEGKDRRKDGRKKDRKFTAATADKYELYQLAVNSPEADVEFLRRVYRELRGRDAKHLREDFCGTAALAAEWLRQGDDFTAEGFDLDPEPVEWGREHNFAPLGPAAERMTFHLQDVRTSGDRRADICTAPNFSYWLWRTRKEMRDYFQFVFDDLARDGVFVIDLYGGPEAMIEMEELRSIGRGATYVWDQIEYWPGTGEYRTAIHFRFRDGTELRDCFEYQWRFWHLTELRDLLEEVGFRDVAPYFEGSDPDDPESGDGDFQRDERGENCEAWIGYLVAAK